MDDVGTAGPCRARGDYKSRDFAFSDARPRSPTARRYRTNHSAPLPLTRPTTPHHKCIARAHGPRACLAFYTARTADLKHTTPSPVPSYPPPPNTNHNCAEKQQLNRQRIIRRNKTVPRKSYVHGIGVHVRSPLPLAHHHQMGFSGFPGRMSSLPLPTTTNTASNSSSDVFFCT